MTLQVTFVGAGPGDPDLLTLRAARLLENADIVLYDALVGAGVLALIRKGAQRICVGKRAGGHSMTQDEINRLMVVCAQRGRHVIRLKGGDPALFGRLGEEMAALRRAGVTFEIVPGITTASAAAASAKISLTERGVAHRVQFVAGRLHAGADGIDWRAAADPAATTVVYMPRAAAAEIASNFVEAGLAPGTAVLLIANVSRPDEQHRVTTLTSLEREAASFAEDAPLLVVIGDVTRHTEIARKNAVPFAACATHRR